MFCCTLLYVHSSIAIILMGKRELVALLNLSSWCLVMVERLFLAVPSGCLRFLIAVFPDHTHLVFLKYFDVSQSVTLRCDASNLGLGAVLLQDNQPVAYASRSLTITETRYAQIDEVFLSWVFVLERFSQFTFGKQIMVESDHKPLKTIAKKPLANAPPRLQRMLLRLQKYDFVIQYDMFLKRLSFGSK